MGKVIIRVVPIPFCLPLVDDVQQDSSSWFANMVLAGQIENPLAREPGYIYYHTEPKIDLYQTWNDFISEEKKRFYLE